MIPCAWPFATGLIRPSSFPLAQLLRDLRFEAKR